MSIYGDLMNLSNVQQGNQPEPGQSAQDTADSLAPRKRKASRRRKTEQNGIVIPRHHDTTTPSMVSRHHDTIIETVRAAVKVFGKEAATHRFTPEEKKAVADIIYAYKRLGIKTSENEVARIGVNYLITDYRENGENSILGRVLKALNE